MPGSIWSGCNSYVLKRTLIATARHENGRLIADPFDAQIDCSRALQWLYELLSALDSKASALMRLNGVMVAAAAFLVSTSERRTSVPNVTLNDIKIILSSALLSSLSIALCLYVVSVSWSFLGKVYLNNSGQHDFTNEFESLQDVAKRRQVSYRVAWYLSAFATALFLYEFGAHTFAALMR